MGDYRTTTGQSRPLTTKGRHRKKLIISLAFLVVLSTVVSTGILVKVDRYTTASGYVTTEDYAEVRPGTTGTVKKIFARTGEYVEQGTLLIQLEADEEEASRDEAINRVKKLEVSLNKRETEIQTILERRKTDAEADIARRKVLLAEQKQNHEAAVAIADLQLQNARTRLKRTRELVTKGLKAASALEDEKIKEQSAAVQLASLKAKNLLIHETLLRKDEQIGKELLAREQETYKKEIDAMRREIEVAQEAVRRAEARCRTKKIYAPISGQLLRYEFVVGELVRPDGVLYEVFGGARQVLKLQISERYAAKVAVGQLYSARLESFRGFQTHYFKGKIESLRNVIQAEGRSTYRVAYCDFNAEGRNIPPGTTASARIYYGKSCLWFHLFNIDL